MFRALSALIRITVVVVPFAVVAFWGYVYVREALRLLEAPGVPFNVTYKARGGSVTVTGESYSIDLRRGVARASRLQLSDPKGGVLARLTQVEATGLKPYQIQDQVVHVRASGLAARLTRLRSGGFDFEQVIPERKGPPTKLPFDLVLNDARVELVDLMGRRPWRQNVSATQVRVTGMGDDWIATTAVHAPGIGDFPVHLQNDAGFGLQFATRTTGAEVAPVLAHFLETPPLSKRAELRGLTARSIRLVGPVRVFIPESKTPRVETRLVAHVRDARYREYSVDQAKFTGMASLDGASGVLQAESNGNRVRFDGSAVWAKGVVAGGKANAYTPGIQALPMWVRRQIPAGTSFRDARFDGWVSYKSLEDFRVSGQAQAAEARYQGEVASGLNAHVQVLPRTLVANVRQATYGGEPVSGAFALDIRAKTLSGTVAARKVDFGSLARRFGLKGLEGEGSVVASVGGTLTQPAVDFDVNGQARYAADGRTLGGRFDVSGRYGNNAVDIRRALLTGDFGLVSASGSIGQQGSLGIQVVGRSLNPKVIDPDFTGRANMVARIGGTAKSPRASGYLEAYNFSARNYLVPAFASDFTVDRQGAQLQAIRAVRGPTEVAGDASYRFANRAIDSRLRIQGLQIADLLGEEFVGAIDLPDARVSGTLDRLRVTAPIVGRNVVAQGIKIDAIAGRIESDGRVARLDDASAQVAGGVVRGNARYNLQRNAGTADVTATGLALQTIMPKLSTAVSVDGAAGGVARVAFNSKGLTSLSASGKLDEVAVNETKLGSGRWDLAFNGNRYTGYLGIGSPTGYVELNDLAYDPKTGAAAGAVYLLNSQLQDLVAITRRYFPNLSYDALEALRTTSGQVNLGATFAGTLENPQLNVDKLTASNLKYRDVNLGNLSTTFAFATDRWDIQSLSLSGEAIKANASGVVDQRGNTDISGDIPTVALAEIGRIFPPLAGYTGTASVEFNATGPTKNPDVRLSLQGSELFRGPGEEAGKGGGLHTQINGRIIGAENRLTIDGVYSYRGFAGNLQASAPFEFPRGIPNDGAASARLTLTPRDLKQIAPELTGLDPTRTSGTIGGEIVARGTPNNLNVTGDISLMAESLGFVIPPKKPGDRPTPITDVLRNVNTKITFANNQLALASDLDSSRGGHLRANVSTPVPELRRLAETLRDQGLSAVMNNPLTGDVTLTSLAARQQFEGNTFVGGIADGRIEVGGTLRNPRLTGAVALSKVDSVIPTFEPGTAAGGDVSVNPNFDLRISLSEPAHLRTTGADLFVLGGGRVTGSLASPQVQSTLELEKGSIRLPAALVRLEPGGTVSLNYQPAPGGAFTSIDVDLEGRTALTALRYGDVYERYDITLGVRGDLLREGGLTLTAQSDPGDLSQERILALLGHTELLSSLGEGFGQSSTERRFREALAGYALPALTDPITSRLAQGLGLDYLTLEYNPFEQTSFVFAKSLGGGFLIQGRRQIGEPPPGFRPLYDLRLVYRPRRVRGVLSRFSFSIGSDQDRPFKIALEYGTRF